METNTTKETLKKIMKGKDLTWLNPQNLMKLYELLEEVYDQAHTAGRNAEREELREWVEGMEEEPWAWKSLQFKAEVEDKNTGYKQALTDIKNHLTE